MEIYSLTGHDASDPKEFFVDGSNSTCGASTLWGLRSVSFKEMVERVLLRRQDNDRRKRKEAFIVFSDVISKYSLYNDTGGVGFANYIKENNLGTIVETETRKNPNTGNMIKMWIWSPPHYTLDPELKFDFPKDLGFLENRNK